MNIPKASVTKIHTVVNSFLCCWHDSHSLCTVD